MENAIGYKELLALVCEANGLLDSKGRISLDVIISGDLPSAAKEAAEEIELFLGESIPDRYNLLTPSKNEGQCVFRLQMEDGEFISVYYDVRESELVFPN